MIAARSRPIAVGWKGLSTCVLAEAGVERDEVGLVRIPYRTAAGELWAHRVVAPSGRRWWAPGDGRPVIPYGLEALTDPPTDRGLLIAEGESDALALRRFFGWGFDVLGIPGSSTWRASWSEYIDPYELVYVVGDGDDAGRRFAWAVKADVPRARVLTLPDGEDARSLIQSADPCAIDRLLDEADLYFAFFAPRAAAAT